MRMFEETLKKLFINYTIGSVLAVVGVGSTLMVMALNIRQVDLLMLLLIQFFSFCIMLFIEYRAFQKDIHPIRRIFYETNVTEEQFYWALVQAKRFPLLTVRRIALPHFLGLSVPAVALTLSLIFIDVLRIPYMYVAYALFGALLIAMLHAMIEFFLTLRTMRPLIRDMMQIGRMHGFHEAIRATNVVYVPMKIKIGLSVLFIGIFPVLLFVLATEVKLFAEGQNTFSGYWTWTIVVLVISIIFSLFAARVLSEDVERSIEDLLQSMNRVRRKDYELMCDNVYIDEFSELTNGFNHMVDAIVERDEKNKKLLNSFISVMTTALDARDEYTAGHSQRVAVYAVEIGKLLGMTVEQLARLYRSAILHDIGKIGIPDHILLKDGKLTDEEFAWIKKHPVLGENIIRQVQPIEEVQDLLPGIRSHHERIDGKGYPDGLKGEDIPLFGRIIAVADAFDAMTSDRPYRKGMHVEKAVSILLEGRGTQWDAQMVDCFIAFLQEREQEKVS
ncbi:HD domain-containing protein [Anoxybacillus kestanbolensis]|uniref:HD-GYP domain-containing protein n=1 Tax=Anoxybacillus kestanbolensis TaxID=227476 RepID=UPI00208DB02C|nr:HD domain-containing phosphohydrolase [Anoxybacillus kestanbolensis]MCL9970901.1 HD domain-containing protein [Anoxybacillus kestanbolensis]